MPGFSLGTSDTYSLAAVSERLVHYTHRVQSDGRTFGFDGLARTLARSQRRSSTCRPPPPERLAHDLLSPFSMAFAPLC